MNGALAYVHRASIAVPPAGNGNAPRVYVPPAFQVPPNVMPWRLYSPAHTRKTEIAMKLTHARSTLVMMTLCVVGALIAFYMEEETAGASLLALAMATHAGRARTPKAGSGEEE